MESCFDENEKVLVFKVREEIDDCKVPEIRRKADYEIQRYMPKRVIFDFNQVPFMDSAGIGFIIGRYKFINLIGGKLELANLTDSVRKIFEMSGVLRLVSETEMIWVNKTKIKNIMFLGKDFKYYE